MDKRTSILRTAMQLFSTKGSSNTSMQEIAEHCGMSKGSLYQHFKSKEELELSLYQYCFQMLHEQLLRVEGIPGLTARALLIQQIEVLLSFVLELREFLIMQIKDWVNHGKKNMEPQYVKDHNMALLNWAKEKLEDVYGPEIAPYSSDLTLLVHGMFGCYIRLLFDSRLDVSIKKMTEHLMFILDHQTESLLLKKPEPLFSSDTLTNWVQEGLSGVRNSRHPIQIVKQLKQQVKELGMSSDTKKDLLDSLHVLEQELIEPEPRRAILLGMARNCEDTSVPEVDELMKELHVALHPYVQPPSK
ncbi:TetR/AcrR family transcriptional regulator [Paenibacillus shirakamiensis]|nr:TetR/AcrR family transcriptional regulator [Paenibacillus shirakamiensis]